MVIYLHGMKESFIVVVVVVAVERKHSEMGAYMDNGSIRTVIHTKPARVTANEWKRVAAKE